jgi:hypothetical protein
MSQQIQITGGAKVRNLEGVLTGTAGVVNALGINVPSGIPQLDGSGKILVSQLPNSVMEYKGTWNAATNTPTLVNGTGNQGDVYLVSVAGTVNFGAGPITFAVGDQAIYSGTIWQKAGGSTGTVTSVAVTESGDALTITGSPITTSGTINIGFAGTSGQYINGAGGLTTFPSLTGYVPYTGATASVDLGIYGLTSGGLISNHGLRIEGDGINDGGNLQFKQYPSVTVGTLGYTTLSANDSTSFNISFNQPSSINYKNVKLSSSLLTNDVIRTYSFPDLSGTLALLEGAQTFTGKKTFSNGVNITGDVILSGSTGYGGGIRYVQGIIQAYASTETTTEFPDVNSIKYYVGQGSGNYKNFVFDVSNVTSNATRTYNLPDASGTIALTSNLSSYVPYTGATANVNLGTFDLTADVITGATGSFASSGGSDTFAINHSSGSGIALNITKGGNGEGLYINKTSGSGNALTVIGSTSLGALIGTTATFTNSGTGIGVGITNSGNGDGIKITHSLGRAFNIQSSGSGFGIIINNETASTSIPFTIQKQGGSVVSITDAGELTLANSATALSFVKSGGTSSQFLKADGSVDSNTYVTLDTSQTISGAKTFSAATKLDASLLLKDGATISTTSGYGALTFVKSSAQSSLYLTSDTGFTSALNFVNTSSYNYTFPAATGTVALTSDINSAVSGTTGRVPLFTSTNAIGNSQIYDNGTTIGVGSSVTSANKLVSVLTTDSSNAYAIMAWGTGTNTGGFYSNVKSGNIFYAQGEVGGVSGERFKVTNAGNLSASGSGTFGGPLSGTTATFSGNFTFTAGFNQSIGWGGNTSSAAANPLIYSNDNYLALNSKAGSPLYLNFDNTNAASTINMFNGKFILTQGGAATFSGKTNIAKSHSDYAFTVVNTDTNGYGMYLQAGSTNNAIDVFNAAGTTQLFKLTGTGAATFSSSVTAASFSARGASSGYNIFRRDTDVYAGGWYSPSGSILLDVQGVGTALAITSGGNVGIGTSSPVYKLQVVNSSNTLIQLNGNNTTGALDTGFTISADDTKNIYLYQRENAAVVFGTNNAERMRITSGGNVLIGTTSVTDNAGLTIRPVNGANYAQLSIVSNNVSGSNPRLYLEADGINGSGMFYDRNAGLLKVWAGTDAQGVSLASFGTSWGSYSDERLKTDLVPINEALNKIKNIRAVTGRYKTDDIGKSRSFLIAQDIINVFPEAVYKSNDEMQTLSLSYTDMIPLLLKAIQEQQAQIEELKAKTNRLFRDHYGEQIIN